MKRAPARLLDSALLSPLERRVLEAGRAARVDFDVAAAAERLHSAIPGGSTLAQAAVHPTAAASFKLAWLLASATGLGAAAYYGLSARTAAPSPVETLVGATAHVSEAVATEQATDVASAAPVRAPATPHHARASGSARRSAAVGGSPAAVRERRASSRSREAPQASPAISDAQPAIEPRPDRAPTSAPPAISSAPPVAPDLKQPLVMAELRDVARARALLERNPSEALVVLEQLGATHPRGFMLEERAALTVLALAATGQTGLAERRAAEFLRRNPESPFADRVRSAVKR